MDTRSVKDAIREVVENQLRDGDPAETRETLDRLVASGLDREQAVDLIGQAVVDEINEILKDRQPFNRARFAERLGRLR